MWVLSEHILVSRWGVQALYILYHNMLWNKEWCPLQIYNVASICDWAQNYITLSWVKQGMAIYNYPVHCRLYTRQKKETPHFVRGILYKNTCRLVVQSNMPVHMAKKFLLIFLNAFVKARRQFFCQAYMATYFVKKVTAVGYIASVCLVEQ